MKNYDPNTQTSDVQSVKVTFQQWDYRKTLETKVGGNCRGFDVLDCAIDNIFDGLPEDKYGAPYLTLLNSDGDTLLCDDEEERGYDWLKDMVVAVEITALNEAPMTNNDKIAEELAEELVVFSAGHLGDSKMIGYFRHLLERVVTTARESGRAEGYRQGAEAMREKAARKASESCLVPSDGGSPTPDEVAVSDRAAASIRAIPITPPQPAAQGEDEQPRLTAEHIKSWAEQDDVKNAIAKGGNERSA